MAEITDKLKHQICATENLRLRQVGWVSIHRDGTLLKTENQMVIMQALLEILEPSIKPVQTIPIDVHRGTIEGRSIRGYRPTGGTQP